MTDANGRRPWILAIDTATSHVVVAAGALDGTPLGATTWIAGRSHGEQLLPAIGRLHGEANLRRSRIRAVIVGTGPGAFTGLRVGIATAKALAHELRVPLIGISTAEALLAAAPGSSTLLLPAGPNDRLVVRRGESPQLLPAGLEHADGTTGDLAGAAGHGDGNDGLDEDNGQTVDNMLALDLAERAPAEALARGERARAGLATALLRLGAERLAAGDVDDLASVVPEYVSLPRGVRAESGEVTWLRGHP